MVKYLGQKNHDIALYKVFFVVDKKDRGIKNNVEVYTESCGLLISNHFSVNLSVFDVGF
jgi:hypothetical protein